MKKTFLFLSIFLMSALVSTSCNKKANKEESEETTTAEMPAYTVVEKPQVDLAGFTTDADGYIEIFNGKDFTGWRGYGQDSVPGKWTIEDGAIKFNGSGGGEAQDADGGDLIFNY